MGRIRTYRLLLLLLLLHLFSAIFTVSESPDHYFKKKSSFSSKPTFLKPKPKYKEYFELTHPLSSDPLTPSCSYHVIHHIFADTINRPPYTVPYYPPQSCPSSWQYVVLEFRANSIGEQYDRIAGLWLGGAEILRTSTAEPNEYGIYWSVRKDITRYTYLLKQSGLNFTIMLENVVNEVYTGVYHVDVSILYYNDTSVRVPLSSGDNFISLFTEKQKQEDRVLGHGGGGGMYETAPDLVIPISSFHDNKGHWYIIEGESDVHLKKLRFPRNTHRAVLELYVSFHGNDEFWYSNPSNTYVIMNNLTTFRGNGAFREVFVTIDGMFVDSEVPFPVIFTGGINPLFWEPVVGIGAFDLPTYDFDLTPFLGILLDGKDHMIGIGVNDGLSYWLVDANLHLWLDTGLASVEAKSVVYQNPGSSIKRQENFRMLDGSFAIKGTRKTQLVGWIKSSLGNFTTSVTHQYKFRSSIRFSKNGTYKQSKQNLNSKREVRVMNEMGLVISRETVKRKYPLKVVTWNVPGRRKDSSYVLITNISHAFSHQYSNNHFSTSVSNKQISNGWMLVKDHDVLSGEAVTNQTLVSRDSNGCFVRTIAAIDGKLVTDDPSYMEQHQLP